MTARLTNKFKKTILIPLSLLLFILVFTPLGLLSFIVKKFKKTSNKRTFWKIRSRKINSMKKQF